MTTTLPRPIEPGEAKVGQTVRAEANATTVDVVPDPRDQTGQTPMQEQVLLAQTNETLAAYIVSLPEKIAYLLGRIEALEDVVDAAREYVTAESASDWIGRGEAETRIAAALAALDGGEGE